MMIRYPAEGVAENSSVLVSGVDFNRTLLSPCNDLVQVFNITAYMCLTTQEGFSVTLLRFGLTQPTLPPGYFLNIGINSTKYPTSMLGKPILVVVKNASGDVESAGQSVASMWAPTAPARFMTLLYRFTSASLNVGNFTEIEIEMVPQEPIKVGQLVVVTYSPQDLESGRYLASSHGPIDISTLGEFGIRTQQLIPAMFKTYLKIGEVRLRRKVVTSLSVTTFAGPQPLPGEIVHSQVADYVGQPPNPRTLKRHSCSQPNGHDPGLEKRELRD